MTAHGNHKNKGRFLCRLPVENILLSQVAGTTLLQGTQR